MRRRTPGLAILFILIIFGVLLAACGGSAADEPAASATKTPIPLPEEALETQPNAAADQDSAAPPPAVNETAPDTGYPPPPPTPFIPEESYPDDSAASGQEGGMRTFTIVPGESSASYLVDEEFFEDALAKLGISAGEVDVIGTTENLAGQIQVNLDDLSAPLGETFITADLSTLKTDQQQRDRWLRENGGGPQFGTFPQASFTATTISGLPPSYNEGEEVQFQLAGDLTVRGVTVPVVFDVTAVASGDTLTGTAETQLQISNFDIEPPSFARTLTVADDFGIRIHLVAREG